MVIERCVRRKFPDCVRIVIGWLCKRDALQAVINSELNTLPNISKRCKSSTGNTHKRAAHAFSEVIRDLFDPLIVIYHEKDEERNKTLREQYLNVTLKNALERFEKHLEHSSGYLVGDSITYADLALFDTLLIVSGFMGKNVAEGYPHVTKLYKTVEEHPKIAAWVAKRPKTDHWALRVWRKEETWSIWPIFTKLH